MRPCALSCGYIGNRTMEPSGAHWSLESGGGAGGKPNGK